jgi:hypothetical protein
LEMSQNDRKETNLVGNVVKVRDDGDWEQITAVRW